MTTIDNSKDTIIMKKIVRILPILLIALAGSMLFWSCGDDDKDEPISYVNLPAQAKSFLEQYFPSASVISTQKDGNEYEVTLSEGTRIDFNKDGEWIDVDATIGKTIPSGFYPAAIDTYVSTNYTDDGINEISKESRGYEVDLLKGADLIFNYEGTFVGFDN